MRIRQHPPASVAPLPAFAVRIALPLAALAVALSGCSGASGDGKGGTSSAAKAAAKESKAPAGALSRAQAEKVLLNYAKVNNKANATQDRDLMAGIEDGALLQQSQASLEQYPVLPKKEQAGFAKPFLYPAEGARFYLPPKGGKVFMVDTRITGEGVPKDRRRLVAFKRTTGGDTWKAVAVGELAGKIPAVAKDKEGLATVLGPGDRIGALALDSLRSRSSDVYVKGAAKSGCLFASSTALSGWEKEHTAAGRTGDKCLAGEYEAGFSAADTVYGLKTADGGALALYDFGVDLNNYVAAGNQCAGGGLKVTNLPAVTKVYLEGRPITTNLVRSSTVLSLAVVPPSGKDVRVAGYHMQLVGAK